MTEYPTHEFLGTTGESLSVHLASDGEIGIVLDHPLRETCSCYLRPQEARELAAFLIELATLSESERLDDLITHTEAAEILRGEVSQKSLVYIGSLVLRGKLINYADNSEPNPQKRNRVSRAAVMNIKAVSYQ